MSRASSDIAGLLGSRICHDLISPIGAISNGVELLSMAGAGSGPEIGLIAQSVDHAAARIAFFRVAFGAAGAGQSITAAEAGRILADLTRDTRLTFDWQPKGALPRAEVKLAFLLLNCIETALPRGGTVTATRGEDGGWRLHAAAERLRIDAAMWAALPRPYTATGLGAAEVQFLLAPLVAADLGRRIGTALTDTSVEVTF